MAKNCLIYETLNGVKTLQKVSKENGLMTLSGVFGVCGVRNNNQRVYESGNYSKMVTEMKGRIDAEGGIPGELEHPSTMNITLENVSHKVTDINIDENGVVTGTIQLLNTPKGKLAQAIVEGGLPLFISSRATGQVDSRSGNVTLEKISTYDLVGSPGFSQAKLHLNENQVAESINESAIYYIAEKEIEENETPNKENEINEDMEIKELLEKFETLEERVALLETENEELRDQIEEGLEFDLKKIADGIQHWIIEEYSPKVQEWITEEFATANNKELMENVKETLTEDVKNWVVENIAPEIQNWVVEEYSPEIENWCINEFAQGIQNWVVEEVSPEIENWINESYTGKIEAKINESINESKKNSLSSIDETLKVLESIEATKPTYSKKSIITENADEPKYIQEMPADMRVKWDMASNEVKESINRRAKLYNFVNEGSIERFWSSINFDEVKPAQKVYEGLENIVDEREKSIRAKLRSFRINRL